MYKQARVGSSIVILNTGFYANDNFARATKKNTRKIAFSPKAILWLHLSEAY